ncbi:MAG: TetR/AcrR family transcriptional regulator [Thalassovita sp.]
MARPRTFEPDIALEAAMTSFWKHGFSETSYDDLVTDTGVSRKSLYSVFGDKESLFIAALAHYAKIQIPQMYGPLLQEDVTVEDIYGMFMSLREMFLQTPDLKGCMLTNLAGDQAIHNPAIKKVYDDHGDKVISLFTDALIRAGVDEEKAKELGIYYRGVTLALQLMVHAKTEFEVMDRFMNTSLNELRALMK